MRRETVTTGLREELQRLASAKADHRSREAEEAREALFRLENGVYGICTDCDTTIPEKRLDAKPEAIRCIGCQSARELERVA